jgi:sarcosine oxidase / L-pipecolate oxidase
MPPTEVDGKYVLKFCRDETFKNTCKHEASGQLISMPPDQPDQAQRSPSEGLKARLDVVTRGLLGERSKNIRFNTYRVCW